MIRTPQAAGEDGLLDVGAILRLVRGNLGMDVAFVGHFAGADRVFRHVDAGPGGAPFREGDASPLADSYCARVVDGRLPELIPDTGARATRA